MLYRRLWLANNGRSRTLTARHHGTTWPAVAGQQRTLTYTLGHFGHLGHLLWLANNGRSRTLHRTAMVPAPRCGWPTTDAHVHSTPVSFDEAHGCGWPTTDAHVHSFDAAGITLSRCGWPTTDAHVHCVRPSSNPRGGCGWPTTDAHVHYQRRLLCGRPAVAGQQRTLTYTPALPRSLRLGAVAGQQRTLTYTSEVEATQVEALWLANNGRSRTLVFGDHGSTVWLWLANNGRSRTLKAVVGIGLDTAVAGQQRTLTYTAAGVLWRNA